MLTDRYDLPLSTTPAAARDDYVRGCELALIFYPGGACSACGVPALRAFRSRG